MCKNPKSSKIWIVDLDDKADQYVTRFPLSQSYNHWRCQRNVPRLPAMDNSTPVECRTCRWSRPAEKADQMSRLRSSSCAAWTCAPPYPSISDALSASEKDSVLWQWHKNHTVLISINNTFSSLHNWTGNISVISDTYTVSITQTSSSSWNDGQRSTITQDDTELTFHDRCCMVIIMHIFSTVSEI